MCGFVAIFGKAELTPVRAAARRIAHRGPDGEGSARVGQGVLAHRRLAIVDPAAGHQPMLDPDGARGIVYNGEIYNHMKLRDRLTGATFRGHCDTETLLRWVEVKGAGGLADLDGMYAFAVSSQDDWLVARDPVGIKPLYRMEQGKDVWFASEIKALHEAGDGEIHEMPAGSYFSPRTGTASFYELKPGGNPVADESKAEDLLKTALSDAVEKRLMADVPVGAFLSGGLDSSLITALMRRHLPEIHTFSVGLPGSSDLPNAWEVSRALGTIHHEEVFSEADILEHMEKIIYHLESYDRDLVRSAIPCYFVSRLAGRHVKVILTGEGADELFAGYTYLKDYGSAANLGNEVLRLIRGLHNLNLQRVDRMTMANGLEGRVPFLDLEIIKLVLDMAPQLKLVTPERMEKWLLRKSFAGSLPEEILWRVKTQFDEGTGVSATMPRLAEGRVSSEEMQEFAREARDLAPRDPEEAWYYSIFRKHYDIARVRRTIGRWLPPAEPAKA